MAGSSSMPSLPPPCPKSPPDYPDLYGKRRGAAKVQMLEREIGFLEEELKSIEGLQHASRCCKEVVDFVVANSDPIIPTNSKSRKSCRFWKWLCGWSCFNFSWICCCPRCSLHLQMPDCCDCNCNPCNCCDCNCNPCNCCDCNLCNCCDCNLCNCCSCFSRCCSSIGRSCFSCCSSISRSCFSCSCLSCPCFSRKCFSCSCFSSSCFSCLRPKWRCCRCSLPKSAGDAALVLNVQRYAFVLVVKNPVATLSAYVTRIFPQFHMDALFFNMQLFLLQFSLFLRFLWVMNSF
ncbi:guanine nucleotide-binding protein subunit gamma 3 isoform X2 [Vitis riparia]|uniref:guanine nucleotide-binding protein subunit gamma 3 isoform X2 n=1 Tax=Vitis riparia TaxID=96939 RepID=UPI00155AE2D9|nr:guanine nucleotide-binding protein subunit gamma 3 isoform X2 [Vitis riparia]